MFWFVFFTVYTIQLGVHANTVWVQTKEAKRDYQKLKIEDGTIRGIKQDLDNSKKSVFAFRGIPYAKPPVNDLRFEPPQKNEKWTGLLDATTDKAQCVQGLAEAVGSEDCLYVNVYTPNLDGSLPTMVWIHGGAFLSGNSSYSYYRPDPLLEGQDVIIVSFNYRLGILGFLSTGDSVVPGNNGLKDQCMAIKWVHNNIKYFGGDPSKVTIFGESAGSAAVSYQLQSKCASGFYRAAIMQSGNSLCLWALTRNATRIAFDVGRSLGVDTSNSTTLIRDMKKVPVGKLQVVGMIAGAAAIIGNPLAGLMFSPVIEPPVENAFFNYYSDQILSEGHFNQVPVIIGINSMEGAVVDDIPALLRSYFGVYDLNPDNLAPADLTNSSEKRTSASKAIKKHYFGFLPIVLQENAISKFISDDVFNRPTRRTVIHLSKYVPVYFYEFSYKGPIASEVANGMDGVGHGEDLYYFFSYPHNSTEPTDEVVRSRLVKLWTNFAKHMNPTPESDPLLQKIKWKEVGKDPNKLTYLNIGKDLKLSTDPFDKDMKFYDNIYRDYGEPPYNTY